MDSLKFGKILLVILFVISVCTASILAQQDSGTQTVEVVTSPNGLYLAVLQTVAGVSGQMIDVIDVEAMSLIGQIHVEPRGLASTTISIADDGVTVAYVARGEVVTLVNMLTGEEKFAIGASAFGIERLRVNPGGNIVMYPEGGSAILQTVVASPEYNHALTFDNRVVSATWSPTDSRLAVVTSPIRPDFFDGATAQIFRLAFEGNELTPTVEFTIQPAGGIVAWSPDATRIAVARDHGFDIYETTDGTLLTQVEVVMSHQRTPYPLAWSQDGMKIAGGTEDGVVVWDVSTGAEIVRYPGHDVMALAWRSDGSLLQVGQSAFLDGNVIAIGSGPVTPSPTPTPTPTPSPSPTPTPAAFQRLRVTAICSDDPATSRRWRIRNPNPYPVPFAWEMHNSPSGQQGTGTAPVAVNGVPSAVILTTPTERWIPVIEVTANGRSDLAINLGIPCAWP